MLLVILGAGASYDSVPSRPVQKPGKPGVRAKVVDPQREQYRPPLADQLFASVPLNEQVQSSFYPLQEIHPDLSRRRAGESVEDVLERLLAGAARYPRRLNQLMAARLYIRELLRQSHVQWVQNSPLATNHQKLLDRIEEVRGADGPHPTFVTFNYDLLLEEALRQRGVEFGTMPDYIAPGRAAVVKLHGSLDWLRETSVQNIDYSPTAERYLIDYAPELASPGAVFKAADLGRFVVGRSLGVPALALPYRGKHFECPDSHVEALRVSLAQVRGILAIGWRAGEEHFLQLIAESALPDAIQVHAVCGTAAESEKTLATLRAVRPRMMATSLAFDGGFSDYVLSDALGELLEHSTAPRGRLA